MNSTYDQNTILIEALIKKMSEFENALNGMDQRLSTMERFFQDILQAQNTHVQVLSKLLHEVDQLRINRNKLSIRGKSESGGQSDGGSTLPPMALRPR